MIIQIQNFEKALDNLHEVAMRFTSADAGVIRVEGMGFLDFDTVTGGDPAGTRTRPVQHYGQLNVMLCAAAKRAEQATPNPIGLRLPQDLERRSVLVPDKGDMAWQIQ